MLVTVTGPDRTGVTAMLTGILAQQGAILHDIEQVVVQGQLTLCLLVGLPHTRDVLKELLFAAKELKMECNFQPVETIPPDALPATDAGRRSETGCSTGKPSSDARLFDVPKVAGRDTAPDSA